MKLLTLENKQFEFLIFFTPKLDITSSIIFHSLFLLKNLSKLLPEAILLLRLKNQPFDLFIYYSKPILLPLSTFMKFKPI